MKNTVFACAALLLTMFSAAAAVAETLPDPKAMEQRLKLPPMRIKVYEPHFDPSGAGKERRAYMAFPAVAVLDAVMGKGWAAPGNSVRFKALDGYQSVVDAGKLESGDAYLAFALADGGPFRIDNVLQNEKNVELGPWYLVWDDIRNPALLKEGAVQWPYQVNEVEAAAPGDEKVLPPGLAASLVEGGKLVRHHCLSCHKVNGYGGNKMGGNLAAAARTYPEDAFLAWLLSPSTVKPGTTMPGLSTAWPEAERRRVARAMYDYLTHVPLLAGQAELSPVTTINGQVPGGQLLPLQDTSTMLDTIDADGKRLLVMKGTRKAGTRVGIHVHTHGGHTCVLSGEITDFVEGHAPMTWPAGTCYYMPPDTPMSAANLGPVDAVLIDTFNLPPGEDYITILEPGYPGYALAVSK